MDRVELRAEIAQALQELLVCPTLSGDALTNTYGGLRSTVGAQLAGVWLRDHSPLAINRARALGRLKRFAVQVARLGGPIVEVGDEWEAVVIAARSMLAWCDGAPPVDDRIEQGLSGQSLAIFRVLHKALGKYVPFDRFHSGEGPAVLKALGRLAKDLEILAAPFLVERSKPDRRARLMPIPARTK